ncbi:UDP-glucose 4-epimerase-like isoform X1 [Amphibalanus amphitrite]|uniref:UDP-glucose 4-epimerase-like isoform X1 n=2 Tax=Amphibalanus amphitrite TaxID=1232801 RepID=UPI001C913468|nr:UDP-glucose 4-epimerase-like isoform X1 [Amphibalanus amphitrite]
MVATAAECFSEYPAVPQTVVMPAVAGTVLVTGGAGFIGSHTVLELLNLNREVVVVDNLVNAAQGVVKPASLERVERLTGKAVTFYSLDVLDKPALAKVFKQHEISTVIHFAALKAVGESVEKPLAYYRNNVNGTIALLDVMEECGCKSLIFSSSATVYGSPQSLPVDETHPTGVAITNPYGRTKFVIEEILKDLCVADKEFSAVLLRYFNPVGAHASGDIGEDPNGPPNNLMPYVSQVAVGRRPKLQVFGGDYDTPDGTGVRDYLHVVDLAKGHLAALPKSAEPGCHIYNLGTGSGFSVLQVIEAFKKASGRDIPYEVVARRAGDVASLYADSSKAERELGWRAELTLDDMCASAWRWQSRNKYGFSAPPAEGDTNGRA